MTMGPQLRKCTLTAHIVTSLGWLGAVVSFLALNIAALTSPAAEVVRASYVGMGIVGRDLIVPFSVAALAIGVVEALGTPWGLFRYRWVLVKFVLIAGATALFALLHVAEVDRVAQIALSTAPGVKPDVGGLGVGLLRDGILTLLLLIAIAAISVLKPWGLTRHGRRKLLLEQGNHAALAADPAAAALPLSLKVFMSVIGAVVVMFAVMHHLGGHGMHHMAGMSMHGMKGMSMPQH